MSEGTPLPLPHAQKVANQLRDMLLSVCERIEIAGSIRREKPEVKDGELVAIPRFEDGRNLLHERLDALVAENRPGGPSKAMVTDKNGHTAPRWGDDFRKVAYSGIRFDIFMVEEDSWGYQFWLRTGPDNEADKANTFIMTKLKYGKAPFRAEKGKIMLGDLRVPVRNENDWFMLLGMPYIDPKHRSAAAYKSHIEKKGHKWGDAKSLIPTPAPQLRLLWNYPLDVLGAFPVPLDFIDDETGKMWANTTLDRRYGPFELVEKGSIEAKYQHEFLVGAIQRRVEHERLRELLWKDQLIDVPGVLPIHEKLRLRPLDAICPIESISLDLVVPTQPQVYRLGVHQKGYLLQMFLDRPASPWLEPKPGIGVRFVDDAKVYIFDGHHRYMAARGANQASMSFTIHDMPYTLAEFMDDDWADNTDYAFLNDVLEEALMILAEKVPA